MIIVSWYDYNNGNVPISVTEEKFEKLEDAEKFCRLMGFDKEMLPTIHNLESGEVRYIKEEVCT